MSAESFVAGALVASIAIGTFGNREPKVVEKLPENYTIIAKQTDDICMGPGGSTLVTSRVSTQKVEFSGN